MLYNVEEKEKPGTSLESLRLNPAIREIILVFLDSLTFQSIYYVALFENKPQDNALRIKKFK